MSLFLDLHRENPYLGFDDTPFTLDLQGWNSKDQTFCDLIEQTNPTLIIEVGSWYGASAINMAKVAHKMGLKPEILCIDTWLGGLDHLLSPKWSAQLNRKNGYPQMYYHFLSNVIKSNLADTIIPFPATSTIAYKWLVQHKVKAELIYVDASHEEDDVYQDVRNYFNLLTPGGILFGDDWTTFAGVRKGVERACAEKKIEVSNSASGLFWIIRNCDSALS